MEHNKTFFENSFVAIFQWLGGNSFNTKLSCRLCIYCNLYV